MADPQQGGWNAPADPGPLFAKPKAPPENRHPHSGLALDKLAREGRIGARQKAILQVLGSMGPMPDREIQTALGLPERNSVSPRITELIRRRYVAETSSKLVRGHVCRVVSLTATGLAWLKEQNG